MYHKQVGSCRRTGDAVANSLPNLTDEQYAFLLVTLTENVSATIYCLHVGEYVIDEGVVLDHMQKLVAALLPVPKVPEAPKVVGKPVK